MRRHDRLPRGGDRRTHLPRRAVGVRDDYYREKGVTVLPEESVETTSSGSVTTKQGTVVEADAVVAGLGIVPTELAEEPVSRSTTESSTSSGAPGATTCSRGDVARLVTALGGTRRVEHEDHANTHGVP